MPAGPPAYGPPGYGAPAGQQVKVPTGPRSPVPGVTIAVLLIVIGALALITRFTAWDLGPRAFIGSALLVVGLGLVAAAFSSGRTARGGLIALGIVLSLALLAASTLPWTDGPVAVAWATAPSARSPRPRCATSTAAASVA